MVARYLALLVLALGAVPAHAGEARFIRLGSETAPPRGFAEMCENDAALCAKFGDTRGPVENQFAPSVTETLLPIAVPVSATPAVAFSSAEYASLALPMIASDRYELKMPSFLSADHLGVGQFTLAANFRVNLAPALAIETWSPTRPLPAMVHRDVPAITPQPDAATAVALDERAMRKLLKRMNRTVNAGVRQQSDSATYGAGEVWRRSGRGADARGDCEDLAIEKRISLIEAGFPADRLFFAIVYKPVVGLHTVLIARMSDGDIVLDSRYSFVEKWHRAGYSWISAQSPRDGGRWHMVSTARGV